MSIAEDLIRRPAVRRRNAVSYLTVRRWRTAHRAADLAAFKAEKRAKTAEVIAAAADDLANELRALVGAGDGWSVACIACGHSRDPDCWGKCLARAVAEAMALPFLQVFADRLVPGSSHPKEFKRLPPLEWSTRPAGAILLVDDLATSGWHLEEALTMLRAKVPAIGAAWIGGTAEDADPTLNLPAWCRDLPGYVEALA